MTPLREDVIDCLAADLIHINRSTQKTEPALAKSWSVSRDGRVYTLRLRRGVRFSDGQTFDADDVLFSFKVYLDEKIDSPQRDLLVAGGKPIVVGKWISTRCNLNWPSRTQPLNACLMASQCFRGISGKRLSAGHFPDAWTISTPPAQFAGLGPFRLKEYVPGQRIVLERNPYYWKQDRTESASVLNEIVFLFVSSEDAQVIRFQSGDTDILDRFSAEIFRFWKKAERLGAIASTTWDLGLNTTFSSLI